MESQVSDNYNIENDQEGYSDLPAGLTKVNKHASEPGCSE